MAGGDGVPTAAAAAASLSGISVTADGYAPGLSAEVCKARLLGSIVLGEVPPDCAWQGAIS